MKRFYIYAGTAEQARNLSRAMDLSRNEWEYVSGPEKLLGQRQQVILAYGTWRDRSDVDMVMESAAMRQYKVLHIS